MDFVSVFFWVSDTVVTWIHGITKIPWDRSINRLIPFGLPNEGLGFPIMLGRLVWIGLLAGVLIVILSLPGRKRRLTIKGKRKFDPMVLYLPAAALCLWGEYFLIREAFLSEKNLFNSTYVGDLPANFSLLFHGQSNPDVNVRIILGILIFLLILLGLALLLILPVLCYASIRHTHGRLAPLYFLLYLGFFSAGFGLFLIALYYAIVSGFAAAALTTIAELLLFVFLCELLLFGVVSIIGGAVSVTTNDWNNAVARVEAGSDDYGDDYGVIIGSTGETLWGEEALEYVKNHPSVFVKR